MTSQFGNPVMRVWVTTRGSNRTIALSEFDGFFPRLMPLAEVFRAVDRPVTSFHPPSTANKPSTDTYPLQPSHFWPIHIHKWTKTPAAEVTGPYHTETTQYGPPSWTPGPAIHDQDPRHIPFLDLGSDDFGDEESDPTYGANSRASKSSDTEKNSCSVRTDFGNLGKRHKPWEKAIKF
ncbi:hypothetical protein C8R44DRAFT_748965 [Mycena epipterygia]|nr:hypothetical protein C8R44DRAFT_748965 [Mycena epipterygia]